MSVETLEAGERIVSGEIWTARSGQLGRHGASSTSGTKSMDAVILEVSSRAPSGYRCNSPGTRDDSVAFEAQHPRLKIEAAARDVTRLAIASDLHVEFRPWARDRHDSPSERSVLRGNLLR